MAGTSRADSAGLFKGFLVFFIVGDRSWAISQNVMVGGRANDGADLTQVATGALLDAFFEMNLPQPILSVKLHAHAPQELYRELGRFFSTPGALTPSLFNDDSLFPVLARAGIRPEDLEDNLFKLYRKNVRHAVIWLEHLEVDLEAIRRLRGLGMNLVFFDAVVASPYADGVLLDNADAIGTLHACLGRQGLRRIGYVGWDRTSISSVREREAAFRERVPDRGAVRRIPWADRPDLGPALERLAAAWRDGRS